MISTQVSTYDAAMSKRWFGALGIACALIAIFVLVPGLTGAFIFDDGPNIVHNAAIHVTSIDAESLQRAAYSFGPGGGSRALAMLSFGLDHWRGGLDPSVFKTTSLVIHACTVLAMGWFFRSLLVAAGWSGRRSSLGALGLSIAWAVHPLQASSVLYVVQRMQTLATLFLVLALHAYLAARLAQIAGRRSRSAWALTILFGALAFASKEDSVVLPAYLLAMEVTVLRFRGATPHSAAQIHRSWLAIASVGALTYALVAVPHFWSWDSYPGRDYSTAERLLTQPRVLVMYLAQTLVPLPSLLPFYYDWVQPSRSLLDPWTTLPALLTLIILSTAAWVVRGRRPIFSLGIFLFFAGHFVSSNVIGLELAFEHRNHFPLIGVVLAAGDLLALAIDRFRPSARVATTTCLLILALLGGAGYLRAHIWGDPEILATKSTEFAPHSARAWNSLCLLYHELSRGEPGPLLDKAIETCETGSRLPHSVTALTNLIVLKAIRGDLQPSDWDRFHQRLRDAAMTPENARALWVILNPAREAAPLDDDEVLEVIKTVTPRIRLRTVESAAIGYYLLGRTSHPEEALPYFTMAVRDSPAGSQFVTDLIGDLRAQGRDEWADTLAIVHSTGDENRLAH